MKNKGFTLIELLGVIIVFAALVTIITIASNTVVENSEKKLSDVQIENIEKAANAYYLKEGLNNSYNNRAFNMCVNLSYLIENDYIENEKVKDPKDNKNLDGSVVITYKSDQYSYKYQDKKCTYEYEALDSICLAVDETTVTTGNIPTGMYNPGDEYICEVKNNTKYHFFVLSTEGDNVNLIMNRNVYYDEENDIGGVATEENPGVVEWYALSQSAIYGPVTAMTYLHNATKNWNSVPNIIINYKDEGNSYGSITTTEKTTKLIKLDGTVTVTYENLKTRMPSHSEVNDVGCLDHENFSCPIWMIDYLYDTVPDYGIEYQKNPINTSISYWTLSGMGYEGIDSILVGHAGSVGADFVDVRYGVRPVISIPKLDIAN